MQFIRSILGELTTPSAFPDDWYGWASGQLAHTVLGILSVWVVCYSVFQISGEFPFRLYTFWFILGLYILKEFCLDAWNGFDTIEDIMFFAIYGSGGTLLAFSEVVAGESTLLFDASKVSAVFALFSIHLILGVYKRWSSANA